MKNEEWRVKNFLPKQYNILGYKDKNIKDN
jgi:hypothetical protein